MKEHGFPLRLIVPGWYGMAYVKWVTRITASSIPFKGPFQAIDYPEAGCFWSIIEIKFMKERISIGLENIKAPAMQELNYIYIFT